MRIAVLGSGSRGNAFLIEEGDTAILVDVGFSLRRIRMRLKEIGHDLEKIRAIFITHEHGDHIQGLKMIQKYCPVRTYASPGTAEALKQMGLGHATLQEINGDVELDNLKIMPFSIAHDTRDPVGYLVENQEGVRAAVATDMGVMTASVLDTLQDLNALILESNHDEEMLFEGPYPWNVKQRIKSRLGHLSNQQLRDYLPALLSSKLKMLVLAHLSAQNNLPQMASFSAGETLANEGATHVKMKVAGQHTVMNPMEV